MTQDSDLTILLMFFALGVFVCAAVILISSVFIWLELRGLVRQLRRPPQVARDGDGRRIQERI